MTYIVTRLPGEPIVIVGFDLPLTEYLDDIAAWNAYCTRAAAQFSTPLFRIIHLNGSNPDYSDLLLFLHDQREMRPGSIGDPNMRTVVVGSHPLITIGVRRLRDELGMDIPQLESLADALRYVRTEIARSRAV